jgi:hypothetical protein
VLRRDEFLADAPEAGRVAAEVAAELATLR